MTQLAHLFPEAVLAAQTTFRAIMDAFARPGTIQTVAAVNAVPAALHPATAAIALCLLDQDTPVWLDPTLASDEVIQWIRFQTGAPITAKSDESAFALIGDPAAMPGFGAFHPGTPEYPDRSTTVVTQISRFDEGTALQLRGPGIPASRTLQVTPLPSDFAARMAANNALFPLGTDLVFACESQIAALPRTTRLSEGA